MLAAALLQHSWVAPVVLGLVRGGVPVAAEIAAALDAPLDVAIALKIGAPGRPEFGVGAVTPQGAPVYDGHSLRSLGLHPADLQQRCDRIRAEARRREELYRHGRGPLRVRGRSVLLIDDGLATGVTARAALRSLRAGAPERLVLAVPVAAPDSATAMREEADEVICAQQPRPFGAVGSWYQDFGQTTDEEVLALLERQG